MLNILVIVNIYLRKESIMVIFSSSDKNCIELDSVNFDSNIVLASFGTIESNNKNIKRAVIGTVIIMDKKQYCFMDRTKILKGLYANSPAELLANAGPIVNLYLPPKSTLEPLKEWLSYDLKFEECIKIMDRVIDKYSPTSEILNYKYIVEINATRVRAVNILKDSNDRLNIFTFMYDYAESHRVTLKAYDDNTIIKISKNLFDVSSNYHMASHRLAHVGYINILQSTSNGPNYYGTNDLQEAVEFIVGRAVPGKY